MTRRPTKTYSCHCSSYPNGHYLLSKTSYYRHLAGIRSEEGQVINDVDMDQSEDFTATDIAGESEGVESHGDDGEESGGDSGGEDSDGEGEESDEEEGSGGEEESDGEEENNPALDDDAIDQGN
jgi:hypothetical protein